MPDPGTLIDGRYRVVERIGSGGMADVFLADDLQLGRRVALKILHRRFSEDPEFVERFRREASSAAALSHPNVVNVFDRGEWDGTYYIAMEYLPGRPLKTIVRENGALDPVVAIDHTIGVLRAARFAHQRGVIHRDLKPHNVIVDDDGRVRVTDFGIARAGASDMTQTGSIMGTAQYLSPEQAQGQAVSAASDLYAIGIILYELLTGQLPFDGETAVTIALKQVSEEPHRPSELNGAVPPALDAVVLRALAKDPRERFADAGEFIAALEAVRAQMTGNGGGGGTVDFTPVEHPALAVPPEEDRPQRHRRWWWIGAAVAIALAALGVGLWQLLPAGRVTVPQIARCTPQDQATAQLRSGGLHAVVAARRPGGCPAGGVLAQQPASGSVVDRGATVNLTVSSGPGAVTVPAVVGQTRALALRALHQAGLQATITTQASSTAPAGTVISATPAPGGSAPRGSSVALVISSGPQAVKVPDVRGQSRTDAAVALVNAGLKLGNVRRVASTKPAGTVISQSPAAGSTVPGDTAVNLVLAREEGKVAVPNVVGRGETQAAAALGAAGFTVTSTPVPVGDPAQNGVVVSEQPTAGTKAKRGSAVQIGVGAFSSTTTTTTPQAATSTSTSTAAPVAAIP